MWAIKNNTKALKRWENIPFRKPYGNYSVKTRDGMFQTLELEGINPDNYSDEELASFKEHRNKIIRSTFGSDVIVYFHELKHSAAVLPEDNFTNEVAQKIDDEWRQHHFSTSWEERLYISYYISYGTHLKAGRKKAEQYVDNKLDELSRRLLKQLKLYKPSRVMMDDGNGHSPMLAFLFRLVNHTPRVSIAPPGFNSLKKLLCPYSTYFKRHTFQIDTHASKPLFGKVITIREYTDKTTPFILESLRKIDCAYVLTQTFKPIDPAIALEKFQIEYNRRTNLEDAAETQTNELKVAMDYLAGGELGFGEHFFSIVITDSSYERLQECVEDTVSFLAEKSITASAESWWGLELSYWACLPGNSAYISRPSRISTANVASLCSLYRRPVGRLFGNKWGRAVTTMNTSTNSQYHFSWHAPDGVGNTIITGSTGSGKTLLILFLIAQGLREDTWTVFLDQKYGAQIPIEALGGNYNKIMPGQQFLNPFSLELTDLNKYFLNTFVRLLVGDCSANEQDMITTVINQLSTFEPEERTLSNVAHILQGNDKHDDSLYMRLRPWIGDGQYAWAFDNNNPIKLDNRFTGFDLTEILKNDELKTPFVLLIFHFVKTLLDGRKFQFIIDEGWQALDHPETQYEIKDLDKTIRKDEGLVVFLTQDPGDITKCAIADAMIHQTRNFISYPKLDASDEHLKLGFKASDLVNMRSMAAAKDHSFLLRADDESIAGRIDLSDCPYTLDVLECNANLRNIADQMKNLYKDNWFSHYREMKKRRTT